MPPGAPPGSKPGFLSGRYAKVTISGLTLDCFDWEVEVSEEFADATAHGDFFNVPKPIRTDWTARARGYFRRASTDADTAINIGFASTGSQAATFTGFKAIAAAAGDRLFSGTGLVVRANLSASNAMVEQEIEIRGDGVTPTIGI